MSYWNPFVNIFETKKYKNSRTLRTGFMQKMFDTFDVFSGSFFNFRPEKNHRDHIGIFDYATLMIPYTATYLLGHLFDYIENNLSLEPNKEKNPVGMILSLLLTIPLFVMAPPILTLTIVARYIAAAIFTGLTLPIVLMTHGLSKISADTHKNKVSDLQIIKKNNGERLTLGEYLEKKKLNLEDVRIVGIKSTQKKIQLAFKRVDERQKYGRHDDVRFHAVFGFDKKSTSSPRAKRAQSTFASLLKLNIGGLTRLFEKNQISFSLFKVKKKDADLIQSDRLRRVTR